MLTYAKSKNAGLEYGKGGEKKAKWSAAQKDWRECVCGCVSKKEMSFELRVSLPHLTGRRFGALLSEIVPHL
jgi:hypothetical protein